MTGLQMHQRISAAVYQLRANGVVSGDRVLFTMMPSIDFYALAVAAFSIGKQQALSRECIHCGCEHAGGCLVVLDPSMGLERANHCIGTAAPSAWVMPSGSWFKYLKVRILCGGGLLYEATNHRKIYIHIPSLHGKTCL